MNNHATIARVHGFGKPRPAAALMLSPAQEKAYSLLTSAIEGSHVVLLRGGAGSGKTTLIDRLIGERGGKRLTSRELFSLTANGAHPALEDALLEMFEAALEKHDLIIFDDFDLLAEVLQENKYVRGGYWTEGMRSLLDRVRKCGKVLLFTGVRFTQKRNEAASLVPLLSERGRLVVTPPLFTEDYAFHLRVVLGAEAVAGLDLPRIHKHAAHLNPYQLRCLAMFIKQANRFDYDFVRDILDQRMVKANVTTEEVANITFSDLKGFGEIVRQLSIYVTNPLKDDARFVDIGLRPKRGVMLYGPPGTGKTSVGRALARQMEGKFFLIDGTIVTDPSSSFYGQVQRIFMEAKRAAPSVVFIDDADVLFQSDRGTGLSRYLLTMLDGLESETAGKVAVILTAMNPNHLPPALLRSGRVELWLETKLPDEPGRAEMIAGYLADAPDIFRGYDPAHAAPLTEGFSAADMRRLVNDVKALYARDLLAERELSPIGTYFEAAVGDIRRARELLAEATARQMTPVISDELQQLLALRRQEEGRPDQNGVASTNDRGDIPAAYTG